MPALLLLLLLPLPLAASEVATRRAALESAAAVGERLVGVVSGREREIQRHTDAQTH